MAIGKDKRVLLGRRDSAVRLGVTYDKLRALERSRVVVGRQIKGSWFFDQADLDLVAPTIHRMRPDTREGEIAAEAFKLFRDGMHDVDVVIALRMAPARVRELRASYDPAQLVLSGGEVAEARRMMREAGRTFDGPAELVEQIGRLCLRDSRLQSLELERARIDARSSRKRGKRDTLPAPPMSS